MKLKKLGLICICILLSVILTVFCIEIYHNISIKNKQEIETKEVNPEKNETEENKTALLTFVGDLLFEDAYYRSIESGDNKDLYFSKVKKYFEKDDLSIGNMEVPIGNENLTSSGTGYNFCAPMWVGDIISNLGFEVLSTANNHAYDRGQDGIISTIDYFKNNSNILTVGTFKEKSDIENLNIIEKNGIKFGFLAYTYNTNIIPDTDHEYMISYFRKVNSMEIPNEKKEQIKKEVTSLKEQVDVVIVMMHWGDEYTFTLNDNQKTMTNFLNELGVDIIIGNHAHNIQTMEWIEKENKTLVYYALGNFVSADEYIERTTDYFNNAYQIGLLSQVKVTKEDNKITISDITTEPIINYYDNNLRNFTLIPFNEYTEEYETSHYRYDKGLTKEFITNLYHKVIPEEFR